MSVILISATPRRNGPRKSLVTTPTFYGRPSNAEADDDEGESRDLHPAGGSQLMLAKWRSRARSFPRTSAKPDRIPIVGVVHLIFRFFAGSGLPCSFLSSEELTSD